MPLEKLDPKKSINPKRPTRNPGLAKQLRDTAPDNPNVKDGPVTILPELRDKVADALERK